MPAAPAQPVLVRRLCGGRNVAVRCLGPADTEHWFISLHVGNRVCPTCQKKLDKTPLVRCDAPVRSNWE